MKIFGRLWRRKTHQWNNHFVNLFSGGNKTSEESVHQQSIKRNRNEKGRMKRRETKTETKNRTSFKKRIFLSKSPIFGRSIHAAETMRVGELVIATRPFASAVQTRKDCPYCLTCHATNVKFIVCKDCEMVYYCSRRCENLNLTHKFECGTQFHEIKDLDVRCAIQIVLEAMVTFDEFEDLRDFVHRSIENHDGIPTTSDNRSSRLDCILKLQPRKFSTDQDVYEARETTSNAYEHIVTFPKVRKYFKLKNQEGNCFLQHFLAHNVSVIVENGFRISLAVNRGNFTVNCDRILIYDILSMFNHSCCSNLFNFVTGNKMVCITSQRIQQGEQLFICYRPFDYESKVERQKKLSFWNFECHCDRCEYPRDINQDEIQQANRLNKRQIESQLNKLGRWTPQKSAYFLRYIEFLGY